MYTHVSWACAVSAVWLEAGTRVRDHSLMNTRVDPSPDGLLARVVRYEELCHCCAIPTSFAIIPYMYVSTSPAHTGGGICRAGNGQSNGRVGGEGWYRGGCCGARRGGRNTSASLVEQLHTHAAQTVLDQFMHRMGTFCVDIVCHWRSGVGLRYGMCAGVSRSQQQCHIAAIDCRVWTAASFIYCE